MEKKISWFIEPMGSKTNAIIARRLAELNEIADSPNQMLVDDKGKPHPVYQLVSHQRALEFYKSKTQFQLKFKVYTRIGLDSPLRESVIDTEEFRRDKKAKKIIKRYGLKKTGL